MGSGEIPAADFTGTRLSTNTVGNPLVQVVSCRAVDSEWVCEPTEGGVIELTWRKNGFVSGSSHGQNTMAFGTTTQRSNGWSESQTADVEGTILGTRVTTGYGQVGRNHYVEMEIDGPAR